MIKNEHERNRKKVNSTHLKQDFMKEIKTETNPELALTNINKLCTFLNCNSDYFLRALSRYTNLELVLLNDTIHFKGSINVNDFSSFIQNTIEKNFLCKNCNVPFSQKCNSCGYIKPILKKIENISNKEEEENVKKFITFIKNKGSFLYKNYNKNEYKKYVCLLDPEYKKCMSFSDSSSLLKVCKQIKQDLFIIDRKVSNYIHFLYSIRDEKKLKNEDISDVDKFLDDLWNEKNNNISFMIKAEKRLKKDYKYGEYNENTNSTLLVSDSDDE